MLNPAGHDSLELAMPRSLVARHFRRLLGIWQLSSNMRGILYAIPPDKVACGESGFEIPTTADLPDCLSLWGEVEAPRTRALGMPFPVPLLDEGHVAAESTKATNVRRRRG